MTHERLQQLLAWLDEIHWEGDDRTKVDELVSYIDNSTSAPHRRASLGGRINELENLWADESRRAEKAEAERDALRAQVERVRAIAQQGVTEHYADGIAAAVLAALEGK